MAGIPFIPQNDRLDAYQSIVFLCGCNATPVMVEIAKIYFGARD